MSTITKEFTKEQLIEQAKKNIEVLRGAVEKIPGASDAAVIHLKLAEITLASLEAEPVAYADPQGFRNFKAGAARREWMWVNPDAGLIPVYAAPPAPVSVPECFKRLLHHAYGMTMGHDWNKGTMAGHHRTKLCQAVEECRAAMLQGAEPVTTDYKSPDDFICMLTGRAKYLREKGEIKSPELLERAAAALQGESVNTSSIPNGWKLVPIDPTKDMLRAGQSVVGFWLNTVHCYSKMLAAAPAAPQQEVK